MQRTYVTKVPSISTIYMDKTNTEPQLHHIIKDSVQISVLNFNNSKRGSSTFGRINKLLRSFNKLRIDKKDTKGMRIAKSVLKGTDIIKLKPRPVTRMVLAILTMIDEEETGRIGREIEATDTKGGFGNGPLKDSGFGNEPLKDPGRERTTGNHIGAPDDDGDDFLELGAADPHSRAKELALFARSFLKELKTTSRLITGGKQNTTAKRKFRWIWSRKRIQGPRLASALRSSLRSSRDFKAYYDQTTIARMNLAFTFTAAVADIRRAISFAIKTFRPAKVRAYASFSEPHDHTCSQHALEADSDLDEEYECFIQDR
ncbi:hypothetical protein MBM_00065 [Drepanopeziza brunnea f. sp. 'multigermtubi' MB_m1]|uniref:Uncharacterized protein n=1 Tax=Marssonina brunnea f. sp. multigermtubi (strain MB_m1) TaxID=1072389 RepID=K1X767_MARBU|nr:uncharacterized protein MBM_00065 [Drepanopeziza brunnea f. sp. 'multigermtubi' MB_m1]EKD20952.1 hypothetical protein MBM_00065 [Drepanopeziza brunnea f. sp. 'multigermtubi' MB_m1]